MNKSITVYKKPLPKYGLGTLLKAGSSFLSNNSGAVDAIGQLSSGINSGKKKTGFKSFLSGAGSGAATGATLGTIFPGVGNVLGAAGGFLGGGLLGILGANKKKDAEQQEEEDYKNQQELAERRFKENEANLEYQKSLGVLNQYPSEGVSNVNYYGKIYKYGGNLGKRRMLRRAMYGGNPEYLAEDAEVVDFDPTNPPTVHSNGKVNQVSSDMVELDGDSHSDPSGGIAMSGGERIYSDRIAPSPLGKEFLKSYRINSNGTYAEVAKRIGNKIAKQEKDLSSDDRFESTRAQKMKEKLDLAKEILFADQEATKPETEMPTFRYGGKLPKYKNGIDLMKKVGSNLVNYGESRFGQYDPNYLKPDVASTLNKDGKSGISFSDGSTQKPSFLNKVGGFLKDNADMIATGAGFIANEALINKIPLTQKTRMYSPIYMDYTRRDGLQQANVASSARQGLRSINAGSTQTRNAVVGDVVSRAMNASNEVADQENRRRDSIIQSNVQIGNQAGLYNTEMTNRTYGDYQQNRMLQLGEKMKNRNNLITGILGNLEGRMLRDRDAEIMKLIAERDKERGIIGRSDTLESILGRYTKRKTNG